MAYFRCEIVHLFLYDLVAHLLWVYIACPSTSFNFSWILEWEKKKLESNIGIIEAKTRSVRLSLDQYDANDDLNKY